MAQLNEEIAEVFLSARANKACKATRMNVKYLVNIFLIFELFGYLNLDPVPNFSCVVYTAPSRSPNRQLVIYIQ